MGLDVAFNREQAIAAGIEITTMQNGEDGDIARHMVHHDPECPMDRDYLDWLNKSEECVRVPGYGFWRDNDGVDGNIVVRANKWGDLYEPLTQWLKANNIEWSEF